MSPETPSTPDTQDIFAHTLASPHQPPRRAPIVVLLTANAISMIGNQLALIAIPWFVLQTTGSATKTGVAGFFAAIPAIVAAFFGGALVDRLGFKRSSILGDLASGAAVALVPLLYATVGLAYWQLLALVFLANFFDIPGETARSALLPELAELARMRLESASSAIQVIERSSRLIGAPLAGVLIALLGANRVLWLDAATFAASALLVALAVPHLALRGAEEEAPGRYLAGLLDGARYLLHAPLILGVILIVMVMNGVDTPASGVVFPVYVRQVFGSPVALGLLFAASGLGAVIGALLYAWQGRRLPRRSVFLAGLLLIAARYLFLATLPGLPLLLGAQLLMGIASGPLNPIISTLEYERIPAAVRGRVLGAANAGAYFAAPIGLLAGGALVGAIGVAATLALFGACYLAIFAAMLLGPIFRRMDAPASSLATGGHAARRDDGA